MVLLLPVVLRPVRAARRPRLCVLTSQIKSRYFNTATAGMASSSSANADSSDVDVEANLATVLSRIRRAHESADASVRAPAVPRLVAVSKTKTKELVIRAYKAGHRDFGENYIQELFDKSTDSAVQSSCPDIRWHFIGNCQTNKANKLAKCPNLWSVETLASEKLADKLQQQCKAQGKNIRVMIQVNTSGEENKNGVEPSDAASLAKHVSTRCPNLSLSGVMTIGALARSLEAAARAAEAAPGSNPDFASLLEARLSVAAAVGTDSSFLEASMGMSSDFEEAVAMGSTSVRVGSSIFGARAYPKKKTSAQTGEGVAEKMENAKLSS